MKVKELREKLQNLPADMEVIIQKDSEGNEYSPLSSTSCNSVYIPETTYSGSILDLDWSAEDACMSEDEWEEMKHKPRVFILEPVN